MKKLIVQNTRNGLLFSEMVEELRVRGRAGCGRFGFVEGPAGVGKLHSRSYSPKNRRGLLLRRRT